MTNLTDLFCYTVGGIIGTVGTYFFMKAKNTKIIRAIERAQKKCSLKTNSASISNMDKMFNLGKMTAYNELIKLQGGKKKEIEE